MKAERNVATPLETSSVPGCVCPAYTPARTRGLGGFPRNPQSAYWLLRWKYRVPVGGVIVMLLVVPWSETV
jgi:hypothetical protein